MLSFQICAFSFCFFLFLDTGRSRRKELLVCCYTYFLHPTMNSMIFARRLILEICLPIYFGVVDKWWFETCKRRPKTEFNHRKSFQQQPFAYIFRAEKAFSFTFLQHFSHLMEILFGITFSKAIGRLLFHFRSSACGLRLLTLIF